MPTATADLLPVWGANIQRYRRAAHLSQDELAEKVHVSKRAVVAWEAGRDEPRTTKKVAIAYALGVEPGDLFPWPAKAEQILADPDNYYAHARVRARGIAEQVVAQRMAKGEKP